MSGKRIDPERFLGDRKLPDSDASPPDRAERIVAAQILDNPCAAIETALLRVSQGFDNSLSSERWHAALLDRMVLLLSDESHRLLTELIRFRRFKRTYLEMEYGWAKLRYRLSVLRRCLPLVRTELSALRTEIERGLSEA